MPRLGYTMFIRKEKLIMQTQVKTLEERVAEYGGKLDLDGEYDWGEPVGREIW